MAIPLGDKGPNAVGQGLQTGKVHHAPPLAAQDAEPLLDLIEPRAMHGREMQDKAGMRGEPGPKSLAPVRRDIVQDDPYAVWASRSANKAITSTWRLRGSKWPITRPVRVLNQASKFTAPDRRYSCSTRTGRSGAAGVVGWVRERGWRLAPDHTSSSGSNVRVYRSRIGRTWAKKAASCGTCGKSQACPRQGFKRSATQ